MDHLGISLTSYTAYHHEGDKRIHCSTDAAKATWSLSPVVDQVVISEEGVLTIHTNALMPRTVFTIRAVAEGEEIVLPFAIAVQECEFGSTTTLQLIAKSMMNLFQLYNDTALVYNDTLTTQTLCIPHTHYRYTYKPLLDTYLRVYRDENALYHTGFLGRDKPCEGFFSNVESDPIAISFPSVVSIAPDAEKKLLMAGSGIGATKSIDPPLPCDSNTNTDTSTGNESPKTT